MPELPEVHTVVNSLQKIKNLTIKEYHPLWKRACYNKSNSYIKNIIQSHEIKSLYRIGKNIIIKVDNFFLIYQLRMTGYLYNSSTLPKNRKHLRCYFVLNNYSYLIFEDIRKFGGFYYFSNINHFMKRVGIDPFEESFSFRWLKQNIFKKNRSIKALLLDQKFICGIGNIYADEILWESKIHPLKKTNKLSLAEIKNLYRSILFILNKSIKFHGTTFMNFKFDNMKTGNYQKELRVYGKRDEKCHACKKKIIKIKVMGRGTHLCIQCQKI